VAGRDWVDPLDTSFAQRTGGRWNPPDSWPTLYLCYDLDSARAQITRLVESSPVTPDDLADDAYDLLAVALPAAIVVDIVTEAGVAGAGLPPTYPCDAAGQLIPHATCQRIAKGAHASGADGIEARSALVTIDPSATRELAWWPGGQGAVQVAGRVPYGQWRAPAVTDCSALFPADPEGA
jgi:RES domain-containing protein